MGFAVVHRHKAVVIGVTQKARREGVTLVARIVVDVMRACANVKKKKYTINIRTCDHEMRLHGRVQVEMKQ